MDDVPIKGAVSLQTASFVSCQELDGKISWKVVERMAFRGDDQLTTEAAALRDVRIVFVGILLFIVVLWIMLIIYRKSP